MSFETFCSLEQWLSDNLPCRTAPLYKVTLYPTYDDYYLNPELQDSYPHPPPTTDIYDNHMSIDMSIDTESHTESEYDSDYY